MAGVQRNGPNTDAEIGQASVAGAIKGQVFNLEPGNDFRSGLCWLSTAGLWDSDGTVAGGQFVVNGAAQTGGHEIDVSPANVANTVFDASTLGG